MNKSVNHNHQRHTTTTSEAVLTVAGSKCSCVNITSALGVSVNRTVGQTNA